MKKMYYRFQRALNGISVYRTVLYGLCTISLTVVTLSALRLLETPIEHVVLTLMLLLGVSFVAGRLLARIFSTKQNSESWAITALILFLIIAVPTTPQEYLTIAGVALIAVASKYVLAWRKRHLFNPVAIAAVIGGYTGLVQVTWWVGSPVLVPITVIVGGLVLWRIRRFAIVWPFLAVSIVTFFVTSLVQHVSVLETLHACIVSWPLIFAGTLVITEPLTAPTTRTWQIVYASVIGLLGSLHGSVPFLTIELAILIGNGIAFVVGQRHAIALKLLAINEIAPSIYDIVFEPRYPVRFTAGQYLEFTLPHDQVDSRGIRRTFSIASAPQDHTLRFGMKYSYPSSSFKRALRSLGTGRVVYATRIGGNFVLPKDTSRPLVFIAGGIGITPFRSMLADLLEKHEKRDIVVFYAVANVEAMVYKDILERAKEELGVVVVPVIGAPSASWTGEAECITGELLRWYVDDLPDRLIYISGSVNTVACIRMELAKEGVHRRHIVTDYFSGY